MSEFFEHPTIQRARIVLLLLQELWSDDTPGKIMVSGFTAGRVSGLHLENTLLNRACNLVGHDGGEGYVVNIGTYQDYKFGSNQAKESATRFDFDNPQDAARVACDWLEGKTPAIHRSTEENMLHGHPDGLDKYIHMEPLDSFNDHDFCRCLNQEGRLPFFVEYRSKRYLVTIGSDLTGGGFKQATVEYLKSRIQELSFELDSTYNYLGWVKDEVTVWIIGTEEASSSPGGESPTVERAMGPDLNAHRKQFVDQVYRIVERHADTVSDTMANTEVARGRGLSPTDLKNIATTHKHIKETAADIMTLIEGSDHDPGYFLIPRQQENHEQVSAAGLDISDGLRAMFDSIDT